MTKETLQRAKEIEEKINHLTEHLRRLNMPLKEGAFYANIEVYLIPDKYQSRSLKTEYLPISLSDMIALYISKVQTEIDKLEKELEELK